MQRDLYHFPDLVIPFRFIIAPVRRQAELFIKDRGFYPGECRTATKLDHLRGIDLRTWEVWWLDQLWPCRTHEDVAHMEDIYNYARYVCRADIRRWFT